MDGDIISPKPTEEPIPTFGIQGETGVSGSTTVSGGKTYDPNKSTLSEADQQELILQYLLFPQLPQPNVTALNYNDLHQLSIQGVDVSTFISLSATASDQNDIKDMLDAWLKNIKEIDDMKVQADKKREIEGTDSITRTRVEAGNATGAQIVVANTVDAKTNVTVNFNAYVQSLPPEERLPKVNSYIADIGSTYRDVTFGQGISATPFLALGIVIGTPGVLEHTMIDPNIPGVNPVQDAWNALPQQFIHPDLRAELGYLGALMLTGAIYQGAREAISSAVATGAKPSDKDLAKSYAESVVNLIGSPDFNALLKAIVTKNIEPNSPLADQSSRMVKVILLASALAALYKAETQGITAEEFGAMLRGEVEFKEGDPRNRIIAMIQLELNGDIKHGLAPLPEEQKLSIIAGLMAFIDTNPSVEQFTEPGAVFNGVMESGEFETPIQG